jgi:hypothetical protein
MSTQEHAQVIAPPQPAAAPAVEGLLQRRCACGASAGLSGACGECDGGRLSGGRPQLKGRRPGDRSGQGADRLAGRVMRKPAGAGRAPAGQLQRQADPSAGGGPAGAAENRSLGQWGICQLLGLRCTYYRTFRGVRCSFLDCESSDTWVLPGAVSPGICIYECNDGRICACVLIEYDDDQICIFHVCDDELPSAQGEQGNYRRFAERAFQQARAQFVSQPAADGGRPGPPLQPKLRVSQPGDRLEQEADRIAERVIEMPDEAAAETAPENGAGGLARKGAGGDQTRGGESQAGEVGPEAEAALGGLEAGGQPLPEHVRTFFEPRFGHDFSRVRVHADARAHESAQALDALAYTAGRHVVFARGQYDPDSRAGRRLLAHELAHVVQQGAASPSSVMRKASYGLPGSNARAVRPKEGPKTVEVGPAEEAPDVQRQSNPDAGQASPRDGGAQPQQTPQQPRTPPAVAAPTLTLTPGATLTRGATLTAAVGFTPLSGERMTVTGWSYVTPAHGTVTRAATDPDFQRQWSGVMALSGTLELQYQITPAGASAPNPPATVRQAVTVNDRTGATWTAAVTQSPEVAYAGQPSPPTLFSHLGRHDSNASPLPSATGTTIASGPNQQFEYVTTLAAGGFSSLPHIHPNLTNTASAFYRFHLNPSRLYFVVGATRTLIPLAQYSGLSTAGGVLTFNVPNWETFYKRHNYYTVTATSGSTTVPVRDAWWGLVANAPAADVQITNDPAVRAALGIGASGSYRFSWAQRGSWDGYQLMQSPAILVGTRSHEYQHATHSHRANFLKMMRALDPHRLIESTVSTPSSPTTFSARISALWAEIVAPNHELVDETASRAAGRFVQVSGATMAGVNTDPATGDFLGSVWNITGDQQMT